MPRLETLTWYGLGIQHADELFEFAKSNRWDHILAFVSRHDHAELVNCLEPANTAFNTLLHEAARTNTDLTVVQKLVEMGAWCARRNANNQTPLDVAREPGHSQLYDILNPVFKMTAPLEIVQDLEQHFHTYILSHRHAESLVSGLQLPQLAVQLEVGGNPMHFIIPGMFGGCTYRLDNTGSELVLYTLMSSRMDEYSDELHKITVSGIELIAKYKELESDPFLYFELIQGLKRKQQ